jgi:hypothetical protein
MTVYNAAIPQPGDLISNSQSQILGNFIQLNTQFAIDHTAFNTGTGNGDGFHKQVTLNVPLGADPVVAGDKGVVYDKKVAGVSQLFFANSAIATQLTGYSVTASQATASGGLILQYGVGTATVAGATITFPTAFAHCYSVQICGRGTASRVVGVGAIAAANFVAYSNGGNQDIYYLAIGN